MKLQHTYAAEIKKFNRQEMKLALDRERYHGNRRSNTTDISSIIRLSSLANSKYLPAVNPFSRVDFAAHFFAAMQEKFTDETQELHLITMVPERYALALKDADNFKPAGFKNMVGQYLRNCSYIGMIEPAYYPVAANSDHGRGIVHWHAHFVAWGCSNNAIRQIGRNVAMKHDAFVPGRPAFLAKPIQHTKLPRVLRYCLKSPVNKYTFYRTADKVDHQTGELRETYKNSKQHMRPGEDALIASVMRDYYLDDLVLAGGEGTELKAKIKKKALERFHRDNKKLSAF